MATPSHKLTSADQWWPDVVYGFPDSAPQAETFARLVAAEYRDVAVHVFPDGESLVTIPGTAQRPAIFRSFNQPNRKLIEVLMAASALAQRGANHLTLIAPYLAYMRQDIAFHAGEVVSQKVVAGLLANAFGRFISVDPHLHRVATLDAVFGKPGLALTAAAAMGRHYRDHKPSSAAVVVGPDIESGPLATAFAAACGLPWVTARKERHGDRDVAISFADKSAVAGRPAVIVDDVISSGTTIQTMARMLKDAGATEIDVYVTHALFDQAAGAEMLRAGVDRIFSCDSVDHETNAVALAPVLAEGMRAWR